MNDKYFYEGQKELSEKAHQHYKIMNLMYKEQIKKAIEGTKILDNTIPYLNAIDMRGNKLTAWVMPMSTTNTIFEVPDSFGNISVLNYADFTHPGGKFLEGLNGQEECICHDSTLYNVISAFEDSYYEVNKDKELRKCGLYSNKCLASPGIVFSKDGVQKAVNVITCAAPNKNAACILSKKVDEKDNDLAFVDRIRYVVRVAEHIKTNTLIAGAYGCGVFGQDPALCAYAFYQCLLTHEFENLQNVIFAIPPDKNLGIFKNSFLQNTDKAIAKGYNIEEIEKDGKLKIIFNPEEEPRSCFDF